MKKLLFICTANYYRSRFAEAWFNFNKGEELADWSACSRGLMIECAPSPISFHTLDAIERNGIPGDCFQKNPIALSLEDIESAALVVAMKRSEHLPMMQRKFPEWSDKIRYWDVHDLDVWMPDQTLAAIEIQVGLLIVELRHLKAIGVRS